MFDNSNFFTDWSYRDFIVLEKTKNRKKKKIKPLSVPNKTYTLINILTHLKTICLL